MNKAIIAFAAIFLILTTSCSTELNNGVVTNEAAKPEGLSLSSEINTVENSSTNESINKDSHTNDFIKIQSLFEPKYVSIVFGGTPEIIRSYRHYPFGKIVEDSTEGIASYVVFVCCHYQVELQNDLLRMIPSLEMPEHFPEIFMQITQVANATVEEMGHKIKDTFDLFCYYFFDEQDEYFPFVSHVFYNDLEHYSTVTSIHIKDNSRGGVFVVVTNYPEIAAGGHGVRFRNSLKTMEIIVAD
ncbi:MAG: hypothetical protein FWC78_09380 [Defluviitaleaceae bacterium]|nr:hypothetical protein [Defluviitaleaceae bacterium]